MKLVNNKQNRCLKNRDKQQRMLNNKSWIFLFLVLKLEYCKKVVRTHFRKNRYQNGVKKYIE